MTKSEARSVGGIAWKLKVGQPHTVDKDLIGADFSGGFEAGGAGGSNIIILIDTITANAKASYKNAIPVKSRAAGKKNNSTSIYVGRTGLKSLGTRILQILQEQIVEGTISGAADAWREKGLGAEADRAIGDGGADRNLVEVGRSTRSAVEVDHVAGFGGGDVDTEYGGILHAAKADDGAIEVSNCNDHPGAGTEGQANCSTGDICGGFRVIQNLFYVSAGETTQ